MLAVEHEQDEDQEGLEARPIISREEAGDGGSRQ
jgi:hypothetical protein